MIVDNSRRFVENLSKINKHLAEIMFDGLPRLDQVINQELTRARTYTKEDGSPVTDLDLAISSYLQMVAENHLFHFYSEENIGEWKFPLLVVDPLDGTKEFIAGRDEWAVSVALLTGEALSGQGWIYNPLRKKIYTNPSHQTFIEKEIYHGEASRTEWAKGYYQETFDQFQMNQMGSIAYKLARLSAGEIDFVVSLHPKNIWDIAAGTLLCKEAGINFYAKGKLVESFKPSFEGPLIWCHEKLFPKLSKHFC